MWEVWSRSGDAAIDRLLATGVEQMSAREGELAVQTFTEVIRRRPDFAEGWNKRATVYYLMGEYQKSLADCDEVMKRNPYHFGALSGYGMIYLQLDEPAKALDYFQRALQRQPEPRIDPPDRRDAQTAADPAPKGHHLMIDALKKISSPSVANAIETFNVRPRNQGNMSSEIRTLFPELGPLVGYAVTAVIRAEPQPSRATAPRRSAGGTTCCPFPRRASSSFTTSTSRGARAPSGARCRRTSIARSAAPASSPTARCATWTR